MCLTGSVTRQAHVAQTLQLLDSGSSLSGSFSDLVQHTEHVPSTTSDLVLHTRAVPCLATRATGGDDPSYMRRWHARHNARGKLYSYRFTTRRVSITSAVHY
jgi:hypothetical protein